MSLITQGLIVGNLVTKGLGELSPLERALFNNIIRAIANDSDTQSWCNTNYSAYPVVYSGNDEKCPPSEDDYPIVLVYLMNGEMGYELYQQVIEIGITVGLKDTTLSTSTQGNTAVKEYRGVQRIETYRKYVETAAKNATLYGGIIDILEIEYEVNRTFPYFLAGMMLKIANSYYQGGDVFA